MYAERTFRLLPKDAGQPSPRIVPRKVSTSSASASVVASFTNNSNMVEEVVNLSCMVTPGAGQSVDSCVFEILYVESPAFLICSLTPVAVVALKASLNWQGSVLLPPKALLRCLAGFSAGAAANLVELTAFSAVFPTGNLNL